MTAPADAATSALERMIASYPDPTARVNLLPPEVLSARKVRAVRRNVAVALAMIALAAVAANLWFRLDNSRADAALQAELATVTSLQLSQARFAEVPAIRAEVATIDRSLATLMVNDTAWDADLEALATPALAGIDLTGVNATVIDVGLAAAVGLNSTSPGSLDASGAEQVGVLTVTGRAPSYDAAASWVSSLKDVEGFLVPYITGSREVIGTDKPIEFTVEITLSSTVRSLRYTPVAPGSDAAAAAPTLTTEGAP